MFSSIVQGNPATRRLVQGFALSCHEQRQEGCVNGARGGNGRTGRLVVVKKHLNIEWADVAVIFRFDLGVDTRMDSPPPEKKTSASGPWSDTSDDSHTRLRFNHTAPYC